MRATATVEIDKPAEHVFACVDEPEKILGWVEGATEHRYTSERGASAVGQTFHQKIMQGPNLKAFDGTITVFEPYTRFGFDIPSPAYSSKVLFRITSLGPEKCRVDYSIDVTLHTMVAKIIGNTMRIPISGFVRKQMGRLKRYAETGNAG
jgi:uncharacterized protein YndB with AHSA1/START domain